MEITTIIVEVDISVGAELEVGVDVAVDVAGGLVDEVEPGEGELESETAETETVGALPLSSVLINQAPLLELDPVELPAKINPPSLF